MSISECSDDCAYDADFLPRPEIGQLPAAVKGRVNALKNLQLNRMKAESDYYREVNQLDIKFHAKFDEINQQRAKVINGNHEPSGAELEWKSDDEEDDAEAPSENVDNALHPDYPDGVKGIPKFWLHVFKNAMSANEDILLGLIEAHDEEVLAHMTDVTLSPNIDGFTLHFHFEENPFFTNQVLTKDYTYREGPDPQDPLSYGGPEIISTKGCSIDWKKGKDVTKLTMNVETGKDGEPESVEADSFFDFFDPPVVEEEDSEENEYVKAELAADFVVGLFIKEKIIPRAILYFTGGNEEYDDSEEESDSEDEDETIEGDVAPIKGSRKSLTSNRL